MRFKVDISIDKKEISKDKNRIILSLLKNSIRSYNEDLFNSLYIENKNKNFSFSLYINNAKFLSDKIITDNKLTLFISILDDSLSLDIYNALYYQKYKNIKYKDLTLKIENIVMLNEKEINSDEVIFKSLSNIVIREHKNDNKDYFYSFFNEKGKEIFLINLKNQLLSYDEKFKYDLDKIDVEIISNKKIIVNHYNKDIESNKCIFKLKATKRILNFVYKVGIGSLKNSGFGMIDIY